MSLRLLGGMEKNEQMDTHVTEEDREKKRKLEEGKKGKMTKPNDDTVYLRRDIMEALKRSDEKMDSYSRKTDEKIESYSRKTDEKMDEFSKKKTDEMLEEFLQVPSTVGSQIQGMNSSIVKMKEEGDDRYKQFNERITILERKILDMNEKYENRSEVIKKEHVDENQGKTVITGFHSETTESEVTQLLKELINEVGMDFGNTRIECPAKPITHAFINDGERNKFIRSANMLKKELRGRKIKITRSIDAEERFHNKRMEYVKYCIHMRRNILLSLISMNWTSEYVSVKGQIVVKTCQSGSLKFIKYPDVEREVEEQMQKWHKKTHRNCCEQS